MELGLPVVVHNRDSNDAIRPAYLVEIADRLAEERGEEPAVTAARTRENFCRLFSRAAG